MTRTHTVAAPKHHVENGGKAWDTVKPLHRWFSDVRRVIIVDDDAYKVWDLPLCMSLQLTTWSLL